MLECRVGIIDLMREAFDYCHFIVVAVNTCSHDL